MMDNNFIGCTHDLHYILLQLKCHLSEGDMLMQTAKPESECVVASLGAIVCHLKASLIDQFVLTIEKVVANIYYI